MTSPTSSMQVSYLSLTGTTNIDALLALSKWGSSVGTGATVAFSFPWTTYATATWDNNYSSLN